MRIRKIIGAAAVAGGLVVMMAAPALAHVTVNPDSAAKGGFADTHLPGAERDGQRQHGEGRSQAARRSSLLVGERAAEGRLDVSDDAEDPTAHAGDERRRTAGHGIHVRDRLDGRADQAG